MTDVPMPNIGDTQIDREKSIDLSNPIIAALKDTDYVAEELLTKPENVPEYQLLTLLKNEGPMDLETIQSKIDNPLLPVALRNLEGSELISKSGESYSISSKLS